MKPTLYPEGEKKFNNNGIGVLTDVISCSTTWAANGVFDLSMEYPVDGQFFDQIQTGRIVYAIPTPYLQPQPYEIRQITKRMDGIAEIYAQHIAYKLAGVPILPFTAGSVAEALGKLKTNAAIPLDFEFTTDKTTTAAFSVAVPTPAWNLLGGQQGSILDVYGGEWFFDHYTVKLYNKLGQDNGVVIRYGKNLTDLQQEENIESMYTGVLGYWASTEGDIVYSEPKVIAVEGDFAHTKILTLDLSSEWQEKPTPEQIAQHVKAYIKANDLAEPKVSISLTHALLEQTDEYAGLAVLERCSVFDTVTVQFEKLGVNAKARITQSVTNVLTERYESLEVGSVRANFVDTVIEQEQEIQKKPDIGTVQQSINSVANKIIGAKGGSKVDIFDGEKTVGTMYLDTDSVKTAKKVIIINNEGLAFSNSGVNGPWTQAISIDGGLSNQWIETWKLTANIIVAGILSSKDGKSFWNLDTGQIQLNGVFSAIDAAKNILSLSAGQLLLQDQDGNARVRLYRSNDYYGGVLRFEGTKYYAYATSDGIGIREFENPGTIGPTDPIVFDADYNGNVVAKNNVIAGNSVNAPRLNGNLISYKYSEELQAWVVVIDSTKTQSPKLFSGVVNVEN